MSDEESFQLALDADPSNSLLRLIFADWLEEHGDERAMGMRALGDHERCARFREVSQYQNNSSTFSWVSDDNVWGWHGAFVGEGGKYSFTLPLQWIQAVDVFGPWESHMNWRSGWREYPTRRMAEDAAALAFARLTPEQQSAILASVKVPA